MFMCPYFPFFFHHPSSQTNPILVHHPPTKKPRPSMWLISGARRPPPLRRHAVPSAERDQNWWKRTENEDIMRIWWIFHVEIYRDILQYFWFDMIRNGNSTNNEGTVFFLHLKPMDRTHSEVLGDFEPLWHSNLGKAPRRPTWWVLSAENSSFASCCST